jgi:hypothetical protein
MDNKALLQIRTRFWCHSIIESLGMKDFSELAKLEYLTERQFRSKYRAYFPDVASTDKAHIVLCAEAFNIETWRGYFNGKKIPNTKIKNGMNAYEFIGTALPKTQAMYENGPYNLLKILTTNYIKDVISAFAEGITDLYKQSGQAITVYEYNVDTKKHEKSSSFHEWWDKALARGSFRYCYDEYSKILTDPRIQLNEDKCILELINSYIKLNFFGEQPDEFTRILIQGHAIKHLSSLYEIEASQWTKAMPIFSDTITHFSDNKEQIHWINEEEAQFLTD